MRQRNSGSDVRGLSRLERRTQQIGSELLDDARGHRAGLLSSRFWSDWLMSWAMENPAFKAQLFRFVDVFPMLDTSDQVHDYLKDYLTQPGVTLPPGTDMGLRAGRLAKGLMAGFITSRVKALAGEFIAGRDAASALPTLRKRWDQRIAFSVDLLGEACLSDAEAETYRRRYLDLVQTLPGHVERWPAVESLERDHLGPIPRTNVSIKISSLAAHTDPIDFSGSLDRLTDALEPILRAAAERNVLINFDMEQHALTDLTLTLFERCCEKVDFPAGLALQAYLTSGEDDARRVIEWTRRTGRQVTVRLIKGAYWDYELIQAEQMGWPEPVWTSKQHTDACFERMAHLLVSAAPHTPGEGGVKLALGSHNVRSIARTLALLEEHDLPESAVELQMLFGMAEQLKAAVLKRGLRLREYVPIGEMIPGMAYLVRRLLENTSNESWLRAGFSEHASEAQLLASPHGQTPADDRPTPRLAARAAERHRLSAAVDQLADGKPFLNEPLRDFSKAEVRQKFAMAVDEATVPRVEVDANPQHATDAIVRAARAFGDWCNVEQLRRSQIIVTAAGLMRQRRDELAAVVIRESGKTWREADADVAEAIDFLEYYARGAVELMHTERLGRFVGELNHTWYQPRGVAAVISPWNFPLAICAGMTVAALVTGNTVVVKPSSQTPGTAKLLCDILHQSGVPVDAVQLVVGPGSVVGKLLVEDPRVTLIAFTGSKAVGMGILRTAGELANEQGFLKKILCEMGGKNAIIVDESADLDEAVAGTRQSAFGYSGQKCSACSRAITVGRIHDEFLGRLVAASRSLVVGDPAAPGTDVGPVIDTAAAEKIRRYIEIGRSEGTIELAVEVPAGLERRVGKPFVGPHIFSGIEPHHRLANEEIFGPVLSVIHVADFDEALRVAGATAYKLTGGVYSRKPSHLEAARRGYRVGNLYLNRPITGAQVGRQPFGGFGASGTGTKAGGRAYLLNFVEPCASTENTLRHGFAPDLM